MPPRLMERAWAGLLALATAGCATVAPLPPVDLAEPGWTVRSGQAIWRPGAGRPELAGDLLLAWRSEGAGFVQFSKTLPMVEARMDPSGWRIDYPSARRHRTGRGKPSSRILWFQLLRTADEARTAVTDATTGERIEAHLE
jgi:hypothetical protein